MANFDDKSQDILDNSSKELEIQEDVCTIAWLSDPLVVEEGDERSLLLGRALIHRRAREADFMVLTGGLTQKAVFEAVRPALLRNQERILCVPGKTDVTENHQEIFAQFSALPNEWPLRVDLLEGRVAIFGLDTTAGLLSEDELETLDNALAEAESAERKIVVAATDLTNGPLIAIGEKRRDLAEQAEKIEQILKNRKVDLYLYGGTSRVDERKLGETTLIGHPSCTLGVGLSRQRFFTELKIGLTTGKITHEPVAYAPPARRKDMEAAYRNIDDLHTATQLVEHAARSDEATRAFQADLEARAERMKVIDQASSELDAELSLLFDRANGRKQ